MKVPQHLPGKTFDSYHREVFDVKDAHWWTGASSSQKDSTLPESTRIRTWGYLELGYLCVLMCGFAFKRYGSRGRVGGSVETRAAFHHHSNEALVVNKGDPISAFLSCWSTAALRSLLKRAVMWAACETSQQDWAPVVTPQNVLVENPFRSSGTGILSQNFHCF